MKGIVFTEFLEMVEAQHSLALADAIITDAALPHGGAYTAVGTYPVGELLALLVALCTRTSSSPEVVLTAFGEFLAGSFHRRFRHLFEAHGGALDFIANVESYVHVEVRKLYPDAELPTFNAERISPDELVLLYQSPRALPALAVGLIRGTGNAYGEALEVEREDLTADGSHFRFFIRRARP